MRKGWRKQAGFTLIELLVALSIFSIISVAIYSSFAGGVGAWRRAEEFSSIYQTARLVLDDMARELKNAVIISGAEFVGAPQKLSFLTVRQSPYAAHRLANHQITRVTYEVRRDQASSGYALLRQETSDITSTRGDQGEPGLVVGGLSGLTFQYTYKNPKGEILPWMEVWKLTEAIPLGVKIILTVGDTEFRKMVFIAHGFQEEHENKPEG